MEKNEITLSSLYYFRNRWYDPRVGRFVSEDPIGFAASWLQRGSFNLYIYSTNNPLYYKDPFGLDIWFGAVGQLNLAVFGGIFGGTLNLTNIETGEKCSFLILGFKLGIGEDISLSGQMIGHLNGPHCDKDLKGLLMNITIGAEIRSGSFSFAGGTGIGAGYGAGSTLWIGIDIGGATLISCYRTPCECLK